jgi:hypothetical protein
VVTIVAADCEAGHLGPPLAERGEEALHFLQPARVALGRHVEQAAHHVVVEAVELEAQLRTLFQVERAAQFADDGQRLGNRRRPARSGPCVRPASRASLTKRMPPS